LCRKTGADELPPGVGLFTRGWQRAEGGVRNNAASLNTGLELNLGLTPKARCGHRFATTFLPPGYWMPSNSTSKISTECGPMALPAPSAP
jgi:hypothetical protein